jgi:hypothetical protein
MGFIGGGTAFRTFACTSSASQLSEAGPPTSSAFVPLRCKSARKVWDSAPEPSLVSYVTNGIKQKPLTIYFLRKAHGLYKSSPAKGLSPSFWDAEGIEMQTSNRLDGILPGLEHALGTLMLMCHYTGPDVSLIRAPLLYHRRGSAGSPMLFVSSWEIFRPGALAR